MVSIISQPTSIVEKDAIRQKKERAFARSLPKMNGDRERERERERINAAPHPNPAASDLSRSVLIVSDMRHDAYHIVDRREQSAHTRFDGL